MIALHCHPHFPVLHNLSSPSSSSSSSPQIKPHTGPILCSTLSLVSSNPHKNRRIKTVIRRSNYSNGGDRIQESAFFDENGVLEDMDGYLNYLSLEYDSVWDTKPSWCQPWTTALTGVGIITGSWLILNSVVVTSIVVTLTCMWWYIFLYSYPKAYSDMISERKKKVTSGQEDTYGEETKL